MTAVLNIQIDQQTLALLLPLLTNGPQIAQARGPLGGYTPPIGYGQPMPVSHGNGQDEIEENEMHAQTQEDMAQDALEQHLTRNQGRLERNEAGFDQSTARRRRRSEDRGGYARVTILPLPQAFQNIVDSNMPIAPSEMQEVARMLIGAAPITANLRTALETAARVARAENHENLAAIFEFIVSYDPNATRERTRSLEEYMTRPVPGAIPVSPGIAFADFIEAAAGFARVEGAGGLGLFLQRLADVLHGQMPGDATQLPHYFAQIPVETRALSRISERLREFLLAIAQMAGGQGYSEFGSALREAVNAIPSMLVPPAPNAVSVPVPEIHAPGPALANPTPSVNFDNAHAVATSVPPVPPL